MVGFGEQLRSARESNGLTQKALAEQLYVTRQTVSRWECSERYPDIITLKKISEILSVSLDDLLSGKEMTKVAEKNPVVENKTINNITSVLYAFVVIMLFMGIAGEVALYFVSAYTRFGFDFYLPRFIRSIESIVLFVIFAYGLYNQILDKLTPKIIGIILTSYFAVYVLLNGIVDIFGGNYQITDYISGEETFKLYDTYGFPYELTEEYLQEAGIKTSKEEFDKFMNIQKEMAKASTKNISAMASQHKVLLDFKKESTFVYNLYRLKTKVIGLIANEKEVDELSKEGLVVLERTCFYAEQGGQVADTGMLIGDNFKARVLNVIKGPNGQNIHKIKDKIQFKSLNGSCITICSTTSSIKYY